MHRLETILAQCDLDIRSGRPRDAAKRLSHLKTSNVPREWRLHAAKICRRAGLLSLGLRLLAHVPRDTDRRSVRPATPAELAEYAVLLLRSGAVNEALQRLNLIDPTLVPDALLFRAYAHFAQWEFRRAIPELEKYLHATLSPAATLVGRTNLAFALVECRRHAEALVCLDENIQLAQQQQHLHLECYNHALRGQVYLQEENFRAARTEFKLARREDSHSHTHDQFFITKLELITEGLETKSPLPFDRLRQLAQSKRDWSALRDAELYSLKVDFDLGRFLHLYFGTPWPGFRELIQQECDHQPERTVYVLGPKAAPRFDISTGKLDGVEIINVGGKCHQLLEVLLRDFYEPLRIAGLHAGLFPGERFDIATSPDRVRQVLRRARRWLKEMRIPVRILEDHGFYSLVVDGQFSFRVPLERQPIDMVHLHLQRLAKLFPPPTLFSTREICESLDLSVTSVHRLLRQALERGKIERQGPLKRPTGYRLVPTGQAARAA